MRHAQRLQVCVGHYELDALHAGINHAIHRVVTASTHTDDLDLGVVAGLFVKADANVILFFHLRRPSLNLCSDFLLCILCAVFAHSAVTGLNRKAREGFAKFAQKSTLPCPPALLSISNSSRRPVCLAPCERDVHKKSFRSRLRIPAQRVQLAFLPAALATTDVPDTAKLIRQYRGCRPIVTRPHSEPCRQDTNRAFRHDEGCPATTQTARALSAPESRPPCAAKSCAKDDPQPKELQLRFPPESASQSH